MTVPDFWEKKLIRDPLYGFAGLTQQEDRILNSPAMQRLARIKQLAHTYIVYPSAVHTRLEHSIGTLNVAGRVCLQLNLKKRQKQAVRAAALLHDVGHGPFSHLFEEVMRYVNGEEFSHENVTRLIVDEDPSLKRALGPLRTEVLEVLEGNSLISEIISSSLDADKMDYLRRDSLHTGVAYGVFDLERIVRSICKVRGPDREYIAIDEKGMDACESYRLARYSMHTQVYEHHARLVADDMFVRAVTEAIRRRYISRDYFDVGQPATFVSKYLELDDNSIEHLILESGIGLAKTFIQQIRSRSLLKRAYIVPLTRVGVPDPLQREKLRSMSKDDLREAERKIAEEIGVSKGYVIVHLQSIKIKLYERFYQAMGKKEKPILIRKRDGSTSSMDEESPIKATMYPRNRLFVFCPKNKTKEAKIAAEGIFKARSVYIPK